MTGRRGQFDAMSGRAAALDRWGRTAATDRTAATRRAREAFLERFAAEADPHHQMTREARQASAQRLLRAHMTRMARTRELAKRLASDG